MAGHARDHQGPTNRNGRWPGIDARSRPWPRTPDVPGPVEVRRSATASHPRSRNPASTPTRDRPAPRGRPAPRVRDHGRHELHSGRTIARPVHDSTSCAKSYVRGVAPAGNAPAQLSRGSVANCAPAGRARRHQRVVRAALGQPLQLPYAQSAKTPQDPGRDQESTSRAAPTRAGTGRHSNTTGHQLRRRTAAADRTAARAGRGAWPAKCCPCSVDGRTGSRVPESTRPTTRLARRSTWTASGPPGRGWGRATACRRVGSRSSVSDCSLARDESGVGDRERDVVLGQERQHPVVDPPGAGTRPLAQSRGRAGERRRVRVAPRAKSGANCARPASRGRVCAPGRRTAVTSARPGDAMVGGG